MEEVTLHGYASLHSSRPSLTLQLLSVASSSPPNFRAKTLPRSPRLASAFPGSSFLDSPTLRARGTGRRNRSCPGPLPPIRTCHPPCAPRLCNACARYVPWEFFQTPPEKQSRREKLHFRDPS